jgi:hypothetical protein
MGDREFQWWRLRWYWPDRAAAGKAYKMRLLYTGRTVMRLVETNESLKRIIDRQVDVSDVDGVLAGFDIRDKDGYPELVCVKCRLSSKERRLGEVCEVDDGDSMDTLVRMCLDHEHEEGDPEDTASTT